MNKYYITVAQSQPHGPGYFTVNAEDENKARQLTFKALGDRWCSSYLEFADVHPLDRIYRGNINKDFPGEL